MRLGLTFGYPHPTFGFGLSQSNVNLLDLNFGYPRPTAPNARIKPKQQKKPLIFEGHISFMEFQIC